MSLQIQEGAYGVFVGCGIGNEDVVGCASVVELLLESGNHVVVLLFGRLEEYDIGSRKLAEEVVVYLGVEVALRRIYLIDIGVVEYRIYVSVKGDDNSDACGVGKGGGFGYVSAVYGTEDDVHLAHFGARQDGADGGVVIARVVYVEVDGYSFAF